MSVSLTEEPDFSTVTKVLPRFFELDFHEPFCGNHGCACLDVSMFAAPLVVRMMCVAGRMICVAGRMICVAGRMIWVAGRMIWVAGRMIWVAGRMIWVAGRMIWVAGRMIWVVFVCPIRETVAVVVVVAVVAVVMAVVVEVVAVAAWYKQFLLSFFIRQVQAESSTIHLSEFVL